MDMFSPHEVLQRPSQRRRRRLRRRGRDGGDGGWRRGGRAAILKGQLVSKCLFGVIVLTKIATNILQGFLPWNFLFLGTSWKLPGSFLGILGDLVSNIVNKAAYRKPQKAFRKSQGSYKKIQGRNPYNIFVSFLVQTMTPIRHFEINLPLVRENKLNTSEGVSFNFLWAKKILNFFKKYFNIHVFKILFLSFLIQNRLHLRI